MAYAALTGGDIDDVSLWYNVVKANRVGHEYFNYEVETLVDGEFTTVTSAVQRIGMMFAEATGDITVSLYVGDTLIESNTQTILPYKWTIFTFSSPSDDYSVRVEGVGQIITFLDIPAYFIVGDIQPDNFADLYEGDLYLLSTISWVLTNTNTFLNIDNCGALSLPAGTADYKITCSNFVNFGTANLVVTGSSTLNFYAARLTNRGVLTITGVEKQLYTTNTSAPALDGMSVDVADSSTWSVDDKITTAIGLDILTITSIIGNKIAYTPPLETFNGIGNSIINLTHSVTLANDINQVWVSANELYLTNIFLGTLEIGVFSPDISKTILTNCLHYNNQTGGIHYAKSTLNNCVFYKATAAFEETTTSDILCTSALLTLLNSSTTQMTIRESSTVNMDGGTFDNGILNFGAVILLTNVSNETIISNTSADNTTLYMINGVKSGGSIIFDTLEFIDTEMFDIRGDCIGSILVKDCTSSLVNPPIGEPVVLIKAVNAHIANLQFDNCTFYPLPFDGLGPDLVLWNLTNSYIRANFTNCVFPSDLINGSGSFYMVLNSYINYINSKDYLNNSLPNVSTRTCGFHQQDDTLYHSPPISERITPSVLPYDTDTYMATYTETGPFKLYVNSGDQPYVNFVMRKSEDYTGDPPQIVLKSNRAIGYVNDLILATADNTGIWEGVAAQLPPATATGIAEVAVRVYGSEGYINLDTFNASSVNFADGTMIIPNKGMPFARVGNKIQRGNVPNNSGRFVIQTAIANLSSSKTLLLAATQPNAALVIEEIQITCTGLLHRQLIFALRKLETSGLAKGTLLTAYSTTGDGTRSQATWSADLKVEPAAYTDEPYYLTGILNTKGLFLRPNFVISPNGGVGLCLMNTPSQEFDCFITIVFTQLGG